MPFHGFQDVTLPRTVSDTGSRPAGTGPASDLGAYQRLVFDAMRLGCFGAAGLLDPVGVPAPRAFEPPRPAVAFAGEDGRGDAVEEPPIVGDDDSAAGEVEERLLECTQRVDVQIVRR